MSKTPEQWADYYQRGNPTDPLVVIIQQAMAQAVEEFREMAVQPFNKQAERLRKEDERLNALEIAEQLRYADAICALPNPYQSKGA
jgi:hypothetical protein